MTLGPNRWLIGKDAATVSRELATPALVIELDAFERNLMRMAELAKAGGRSLRPHGKAHKAPAIAHRQFEAGAVGICCATLREAEVMAEAGIPGILVTSEIMAAGAAARLARAAEYSSGLMAVVDSEAGVDLLAAFARRENPIGVLVDIDLGQRRTGATDPDAAVRSARRAAEHRNLRYRGVQAYYGHLQHVPALADRRAQVTAEWARLRAVLDALAAAGLPAEIVSGGGTGTHHLDLQDSPFTELQPGSYLFMDKQYAAVALAPEGRPFAQALAVVGRVISIAQPDRVIVDAGTKALSTDAGVPLILRGAPDGAEYRFMGDEHGGVFGSDGGGTLRLGDLVHFVPPHCDPTVALHDRFHVMRDGALVDIWPIEARGH